MRAYAGSRFVVELTGDARTSLKVEAKIAADEDPAIRCAQVWSLVKRLADHGIIRSPDLWEQEPKGVFRLRPRCGLCAFGWFHEHRDKLIVISHFAFRPKRRLAAADIARADLNRQRLYWTQGYGYRN